MSGRAGYVDPNFPNPNGPGDAPVIIYGYTPSIVVGILGCALFFFSGVLHMWQLLKYRSWYFSTIMIGIVFVRAATQSHNTQTLTFRQELVGYAFRCLSSKVDPYRVNFFVLQYFFIVVAPVFFAAAIYTVLSILINVTGPSYAPMRPKLILWIFITCDVVATIIQILGAALIGVSQTNRKDPTSANNILLAGLAFQAASFALFILLFVWFLVKARRVLFKVVSKMFYLSFIVSVILLYVRVGFRLAETSEGIYGELNSKEVFFGCLEFAPVVVAVWLLAIWHPGRCIPKTRPAYVDSERDYHGQRDF